MTYNKEPKSKHEPVETKKKKPVKEFKYNVSKTSDMNALIDRMKLKYNVKLMSNDTNFIVFISDELKIIFKKV